MEMVQMSRAGYDKLMAELKQMDEVDMPAISERVA